MIYESSSQRTKDLTDTLGNTNTPFRMAKVMALSDGRPIIRFFGETTNAQKRYKSLASYTPAVGDSVFLASTSGTYVILGKVV